MIADTLAASSLQRVLVHGHPQREHRAAGEPKTIPANLETVLEGLDIRADAWQQSLEDYEQEFCQAVGPPSALAEVAARMEGHHIKGMAASRRLFREFSSDRAAG